MKCRSRRDRNTGGTTEVSLRPERTRAFCLPGGRRMANERELAERTENALREIADAKDLVALDAVRVRYVGRKDGELTTRMKAVSALPATERPAAGAALNAAKSAI